MAYAVNGRQFAQLRWDDGREILQFWSSEDRAALVQGNPEAYWVVEAFPSAVFAWLDRLDTAEVGEIVTDSWLTRAPKHLVKASPDVGVKR